MDRNTIIGIVIIGAILVLFTYLGKPTKEQIEAQRKADSLAMVQQQQIKNKELSNQNKSYKSGEVEQADSLKKDTTNINLLKNIYGPFSKAALGKEEFFTLENNFVKITISAKGGRPYSVELKKYHTFDSKPLIMFDGDSTIMGLNFYTNNRSIATNNLYFKPVGSETHIVVADKDTAKAMSLRLYAGDNKYIEYTYSLLPKSYMVNFTIKLLGVNDLITTNGSTIDMNWLIYARKQEHIKQTENSYTSIYYNLNDEVDKLSASSREGSTDKNISTNIKWIAYKQQFFSSVLIAKNQFSNAYFKQTTFTDTASNCLKLFNSEIGIPYDSRNDQTISLAFYFGPNHFNTLKQYNLNMEELVNLGGWIVKWINRFLIIPVFNFLNKFIFNYGIIILLLTIFIKLILYPLTYKSYMSMAKMRLLKPQIDEINSRIPSDKAMERQQATMALYKKAGVNPLGGCLPMLLQFPILYAMFRFFPSSIELRQQGFLWAHDLSTYDSIFSWNTYIPFISSSFGNHISLFNLLMTVSTVITIRMNNQASASSTQMPGMKTMSYIMPFMFMFILNNFSAGLTYYYFLANVITIAQNEIFKRVIDEEKLLHQLNENKKKPVKKSKFMERLDQAAKQRGYQVKK
jgi:YidC/Oxa1 family membrane protein insertase